MPHKEPRTGKTLLRATAIVFVVRACDFLFSFLMSSLLATRFGTSAHLDAFFMARRTTAGIADAVGKLIHMTTMPLIVRQMDEGRSAIDVLRGRKALTIFAGLLAFTAAAMFMPGTIVEIFAPGFIGERHEMMDRMVAIMAPMILISMAFWLVSALQQARRSYGLAETSNMVQRMLMVGVLLLLVPPLGILDVSQFLVAASLIALLIIILGSWPLLKAQWALRSRNRGGVASKGAAMAGGGVVAAIIYGVFNQATTLIDFAIASTLVEGSVASLEYGARLASLIPGLVMASLSTVIYPELVRAMQSSDPKAAANGFAHYQRMGFSVQLLVSIGMIFAAEFIVRVLFGYGEFGTESIASTTLTTMGYSAAAIFLTPLTATTSAIYADSSRDCRGAMLHIAAWGIGLRVAALAIMVPLFGVAGIALGAAAATALNMVAALFIAQRRFPDFSAWGQLREFAATGLCGLVASAAGYGMILLLPQTNHLGLQFLNLAAIGLVVVTVFAIMAMALRLPDARMATDMIGRKFGKRRANAA